jgi:hypothetical protein
MPSVAHELLVHLVRNSGELAAELLRLAGAPQTHLALVDGTSAEIASAEFNQIVPTEYRADQVTVFRDAQHLPVLVVIVEVQLKRDLRKRRRWPSYLVAAHDQYRCPCMLLVLAPSASVARWARTPISIGHPGFDLEPLVISYPDVPPSIDLSRAERIPELAVLTALAHPSMQAALRAADVLRGLSPDFTKLYFDAIVAALPEEDHATLEATMLEGYVYQSNFARKYVAQGREEGLHLAVLELARAKLRLSPEDEAAVRALRDPAALTALIVALGEARSAKQARVAFDRARR